MVHALRRRILRTAEHALRENWQRNLAVLWLVQLLSVAGFNTIIPFLPLYVQELGVTDPTQVKLWAGLLSSVPMMTAAVMAPVWGNLADRYGRKLMIMRATLGGAFIVGLMGLTVAPWHLLALRAAQGLFTGIIAAVTVFVSSMVPRTKVGLALGVIQSCVYLGATVVPPLSGLVVDRWGYRLSASMGAVFLLAAALLTLLGVREQFERPQDSQSGETPTRSGMVKAFVSDRALLTTAITLLVVRLAYAFPTGVLALYVQELNRVPERLATVTGVVQSSASLAGALAAVVIGRLGDRLGHARALRYCLMGSALFYVPQALVANPMQLAALQFGLGFFVGGAILSLNALVARRSERGHEGASYGYVFSAGFVGLAIGPLLGSGVASLWSTRSTFAVTGALFLITALTLRRAPSGLPDVEAE